MLTKITKQDTDTDFLKEWKGYTGPLGQPKEPTETNRYDHKGLILEIWLKGDSAPDYIWYCYKCAKLHATMTGYISGMVFIENYGKPYQSFQEMIKRAEKLGLDISKCDRCECGNSPTIVNSWCAECIKSKYSNYKHFLPKEGN